MTAEEIYNKHIEEFKKGDITCTTKSSQEFIASHKTRESVIEAFRSGCIIPELIHQCAERTLTSYQLIGFYSLLGFSSKKSEILFKSHFISALNKLDIK